MEWCHGYLVVVSKKEESESRGTMSGSDSANGEMQIITIYDVKNKLIGRYWKPAVLVLMHSSLLAYYGPIQEVKAVLCEWGAIFVLCSDNRVSIDANHLGKQCQSF